VNAKATFFLPGLNTAFFSWMMKYRIYRLIGLVILAYILNKVDWAQMRQALFKANYLWLVAAFVLNAPQIGLKSVRWQMLLAAQKHSLKLVDAFLFYLSSFFLGVITPGRLGEFTKALYLRQESITNLARGFSSVLVDRLCDLYLLLLLGLVGVVYLTSWTGGGLFVWGGIVCVLLFPLGFLYSGRMGKVLQLLYNKVLSPKIPELVKGGAEQFLKGCQEILGWHLFLAELLTMLAYTLFFFQCFLIAQALALPISFLELTLIMAMTNLFTFLPVSISGLGTREAALLFLLSPRGISLELILAYSMSVLVVFFVGTGIIGALAWWMRPLKFLHSKRIPSASPSV
jgi:uncharacterized protein (TIRG00374 family)